MGRGERGRGWDRPLSRMAAHVGRLEARRMVQLELIVGPMYSGKTSALILKARRHLCAGENVLLVKHAEDTRYSSNKVDSHNEGLSERASVVVSSLSEIDDSFLIDVVAVDEGQFFPDLHETVVDWIRDHPKLLVMVAALQSDYRREPFGDVHMLMCKGKVEQMVGVCHFCHRDGALNTLRTIQRDSNRFVGTEGYFCACDACWWANQCSGDIAPMCIAREQSHAV